MKNKIMILMIVSLIISIGVSAFEEVENSVSVHGKPGVNCEAGTVTCRDLTNDGIEDLVICKFDGSNWYLKEECKYGCALTPYAAKCKEKPQPTKEGAFWISLEKKILPKIFPYLLLAIVIYIAYKNLIKKKNQKKRKKY